MTKNKFLKSLIVISSILIGSVLHAQMKLGNNPTSINPNAILEMESTNKGMLLPRLSLTSTTSVSPLLAHVMGMTVYNTATAGDVTPGFYYNDGAKWVRIASPSSANNTTSGPLVTIGNGTGATFTAMTVSVDTTAMKSFISSAVQNGAIVGMNTTSGSLVTITNGAGATLTAMTVSVDTTALKSFVANNIGKSPIKDSVSSTVSTVIQAGTITGQNLTAGSLLQTTGTPTGASLKTAGYQVDTTALKSFITNTATSGAITGQNLTAGSLLQTTGTPIGASLKTAGYQVDTTALKSFITNTATSGAITGQNLTAGSLLQTTGTPTGASLKTAGYQVDTTALKTFVANRTTNILSNTTNTITSTVNGVVATASAVNSVSNSFVVATRSLITTVNGVASSAVTIPNGPDSTLANNGLNLNGDTVQLGGTLAKPTTIATSAANTLALTGLENGSQEDCIVVSDCSTGALKKLPSSAIRRSRVVTTSASSFTIPDTAEVIIYIGTGNSTFTLPTASSSYGREIRILNYAASDVNAQITLSTAVITEGATTNITDARINSKGSTYEFPAGLGSQEFNTITIISNGTSWFKLGN